METVSVQSVATQICTLKLWKWPTKQ